MRAQNALKPREISQGFSVDANCEQLATRPGVAASERDSLPIAQRCPPKVYPIAGGRSWENCKDVLLFD